MPHRSPLQAVTVCASLAPAFTLALRQALLRSLSVLTGLALLTGSAALQAQAWPNKPVRVVVPYVAGGNTDGIARVAADILSRNLNQQFVVENRPGAGGAIASELVAKSPSDGYTLFMTAQGVFAILPHIQKVNFDPLKDFAPASVVGLNGFVLAAHTSLGVKTVKEFVDYVKSRPGKLAYASGGNGSISHLSAAMFAHRAGLDMIHVPYKGGAAAVADLVAGQVAMYFGNFSEVVPHGKSGRVNILGVSTDKRDRQLPDTPAITETYNGFRTVTWNGLVAPAGTPRDILDRIALEIQKGLKDPQLVDRLHRIGVDPWGSTPAEFSDAIRKDYELYRDVVKTAGIKAE